MIEIKIYFEDKPLTKLPLNTKQNLTKIRECLLNVIKVPFIFLNDEEEKI